MSHDSTRYEFIAGLRDLADALEANPDLALPIGTSTGMHERIGVHVRSRESMQQWVDILDDVESQKVDGSNYYVFGRIRGVRFDIFTGATVVGRRTRREMETFAVEPFECRSVAAT